MSKINLLHVVFGVMSGGVEQMILNYFSGKEFKNYNLYIAYSGEPDERCLNEFKKIGFKTIQLKSKTRYFHKYYQEIKKILVEYEINIVHSHINTENYLVMKAAYDINVPVRISHSHGLPDPTKYRVKKIARRLKAYIGNKYSNYKFACSTKAGDYLFKNNKYKIIYNAISTAKFKFNNETRNIIRKELNITDEVLIGYIARFNNGKNQEFLIETLSKIDLVKKNIKLILIGSGPFKDDIINLIKDKKIEDRVIILSSKKNIYDYYQAMDLFVFPSIEEGLGMVAIESQINNLPCICSKGVPIDTKISDNIIYIDLDENLWKKEIEKKAILRKNTIEKCNYKQYEISYQRKVLDEIYNKAVENEKHSN